jgi:hypothetical protein
VDSLGIEAQNDLGNQGKRHPLKSRLSRSLIGFLSSHRTPGEGKTRVYSNITHPGRREASAADTGQGFAILIVEDQALIALEIEDAVRGNGASAVGYAARRSEALTLIETAS